MTARVTLGKMQNPVRGFLHGGAAVLSLVGLALMLMRSDGNGDAVAASLVFGIALVVMYTTSALYHSIPWSELSKTRMRKADHSMIYLVVAATFTPVAMASLNGATLAISLILVWGIAITGIFLKLFRPRVTTGLSITLQLLMGWSALIWTPAIVTELGVMAIVSILLGGLSYTAGAIVFATKRPRLFPRTFSYHELFHALVIVGSTFHFVVVYWYAIPHMVG